MTTPEARERLLVAATPLFAARGIAAVSVEDIAERAGISVPTLYGFYAGIPQLVAATLSRWSQAQLGRMRVALEPDVEPQQRLERLFAVLADWFSQEDYRGSYITNAAAELAALPVPGEPEEVRAAFEAARAAIAEHRRAERALLVDLARAAGAADPEGLADQLQVVVDGAVEGAKVAPPHRRAVVAETASAIALALLTQGTAAGGPPVHP